MNDYEFTPEELKYAHDKAFNEGWQLGYLDRPFPTDTLWRDQAAFSDGYLQGKIKSFAQLVGDILIEIHERNQADALVAMTRISNVLKKYEES